MSNKHEGQTENHIIHRWEYANAAARTGASGFVSADVGKACRQTDTDVWYILTATTPTWQEIGAGSGTGDVIGPGPTVTNEAIARMDGTGGYTIQESPVTIADDGSIIQTVEDAVTAAVTTIISFIKNSTGTVANGFGIKRQTTLEDAVAADQVVMEEEVSWIDATNKDTQLRILLMSDGVLSEMAVITTPTTVPTEPIGNARGDGAVDLQVDRVALTEVASGDKSVIVGGISNTAAGLASAILGGWLGKATGEEAACIGGFRNLSDMDGQVSYGAPSITSGRDGATQGSLVVIARAVASHSDTTWYTLNPDGGSVADMVLDTDTAWTVFVQLVGLAAGATYQWSAEVSGLVVNDGGTVTVQSGSVNYIYRSDAAYELQLLADDVNDALLVQVRRNGGTDRNVKWVATVILTQVKV